MAGCTKGAERQDGAEAGCGLVAAAGSFGARMTTPASDKYAMDTRYIIILTELPIVKRFSFIRIAEIGEVGSRY